MAFSWNMTEWQLRPLGDDEVAYFSTPLLISGTIVVMELVFWSAKTQEWIHVVRDRTERHTLFYPGSRRREVAADEMPWYEWFFAQSPEVQRQVATQRRG